MMAAGGNMEAKVYRLSKKWRTICIVLGVVCCLLIVMIPFGILMFVLAAKARIVMYDDRVEIKWMGTRKIAWSDFERLSQGTASVHGAGAVGAMVGAALISGPITYKLKNQKDVGSRIAVHWHENAPEILQEMQRRTGLQIQGLR
jgi:hypothetical protein